MKETKKKFRFSDENFTTVYVIVDFSYGISAKSGHQLRTKLKQLINVK